MKMIELNGDAWKIAATRYTEMIFDGSAKREAYATCFPEKVEELREAKGEKVLAAEIGKAINRLENTKFVQDCFTSANKNWWMHFMTKKQKIYEKLYETAMNEDEKTADRLNASKIFLSYIPDAPKEEKLTVEIKVGSDEFKAMLNEKKRALHQAANGGEVIDVEEV